MIEKNTSLNIKSNLKLILLEKIENEAPEQVEEFISSIPENELVAAIKEDLKLFIEKAVEKGHLKIVQLCLDNNRGEIDLNYVSKDYLQDTMLINAVISNHIEIARLLISHGADVNLIGEYARPPLYNAKSVEMIKLLIENGANLNYQFTGEGRESPLSWFITKDSFPGKKEIVEFFLHNGDNIDQDINLDICLLRVINTLEGIDRNEMVKILLKNNANVNATDDEGCTPLHYAAKDLAGKEFAEILLNYGIGIDIENDKGKTPIDIAFLEGNYELFELLALNGAIVPYNTFKNLPDTPIEKKTIQDKVLTIYNYSSTAETLFNHDYMGFNQEAETIGSINPVVLQILKSHFKLKGVPSGWEDYMKGLPVADQLKPWFDEVKKEVEQNMKELNEFISPFIAGMLCSRYPLNFPTPCPPLMFDSELAKNETLDNRRKFELSLNSYRELPQYLQPGKFPTDLEKEDNLKNFMHQIILSNEPLNPMIQNLERILTTNIFYKQDRDNVTSVLNAFKTPQPYFVDAIRELNETIKEITSTSSKQRDERIERRKLEEVARDHSQDIKRFFPIAKRVKTSEFVDRIKADKEKGKDKEL
ncbi:ankyrin repeat domain-containing protein [Candidatus Jidaibacter acanthamoebae]|nr:ankyrin repeat domain-containing protein [Candidatus Jidaibacter acanthamoeba]